jgi:hypothetical protein
VVENKVNLVRLHPKRSTILFFQPKDTVVHLLQTSVTTKVAEANFSKMKKREYKYYCTVLVQKHLAHQHTFASMTVGFSIARSSNVCKAKRSVS